MKHAVTSPIKLSLFPWNDGWRISPRKRLDSRTDGDRRYEEPVWYRSLKSIDRKEKVSKMIINTSIIARFQFHPRYRSLLWESCTCPNGDAWLSMRGQSVFWTRDLRCQLTSGNINDQHSFQRVFVLSCPTTCTVQLNKRLPSFVILTPWMFDKIYDGARFLTWSIDASNRWQKMAQIVTRFSIRKSGRNLENIICDSYFLLTAYTKFTGKINTRRSSVFIP